MNTYKYTGVKYLSNNCVKQVIIWLEGEIGPNAVTALAQ